MVGTSSTFCGDRGVNDRLLARENGANDRAGRGSERHGNPGGLRATPRRDASASALGALSSEIWHPSAEMGQRAFSMRPISQRHLHRGQQGRAPERASAAPGENHGAAVAAAH
jgi:hypothetical protein